jgi:hypothetical protein
VYVAITHLHSPLHTPLCCQKGTGAFWPVGGSQGHLNAAKTPKD